VRNIPIALQDSLDTGSTTLCYLLKITATNGTSFGVTSLDVDIDYDDGAGALVYQSRIGLNQSGIATTEGLEVSNANSQMLLVQQTEFNEADIQNGLLDYAKYVLYRVDWKALADGHYIVSTGTSGIVETRDGVSGIIELRGLSQQVKQTFVELYSITCRAEFGSVTTSQNKAPCNFDISGLWESSSVLTVGVEADIEFTTILPIPTGPLGDLTYVPGVVRFTSGLNNGAVIEIQSYEGNVMRLKFPTPFPISPGDLIDARPDCHKQYVEDCKDKYDNHEWFRGEYKIPLADEGPAGQPGATYPGFGTGIVPGTLP
jgi:uncharacterized phage protein (TIGR02218 family)